MTKTNTQNNYKLDDLLELLKDAKDKYNFWEGIYHDNDGNHSLQEFATLKCDVLRNEIEYIKDLIINCNNF